MEFINDPYYTDDTIAAVATPPGEGGVAIIRISGAEAVAVANKIFSRDVSTFASHTVHYGAVIDLAGTPIDDALVIPMLGKRSYTGEDTVEIQCHGGHLITRRVLETAIKAGARAARPGEFTFRAFFNGKIDLAQAEAVQELIGAKNEKALIAAEEQLQGRLSRKISQFQTELYDTAAILEAWVDFPEEGLEFSSVDEVCALLQQRIDQMKKLVGTFHDGRIVHEGIALCLVGAPNVGKSSLMNAFLEKDRAIVTDIPGTTRDLLEDHFKIKGVNIRLTDTAGIREASEVVEKEGIRRSRLAMQQADVVLLVLDSAKGISEEEQKLLSEVPREKTVVVWNKIDLSPNGTKVNFPNVASISALTREGVDELQDIIEKVIWQWGAPSGELLISNVRHKQALEEAIVAAEQVIAGLKEDLSPEFISIEMRHCMNALGRIIGTNVTEDLLSTIFSKFCIGK